MKIINKLKQLIKNKKDITIVFQSGRHIYLDFSKGESITILEDDGFIHIRNIVDGGEIIDDLYFKSDEVSMLLESKDDKRSILP